MIDRNKSRLPLLYALALILVFFFAIIYASRNRIQRAPSDMTAFSGGTFEASGVVYVPGTDGVLFVDDDHTDEVFYMRVGEDRKQAGRITAVKLSANIIDLCPVGALNNKPYRYRARAWEMTQHPLVSPHDSVGANLYAHVLRGRIMRIVPRANEEVNEIWIADRDRYSYQGVYSEDRLMKPLVRDNGVWQDGALLLHFAARGQWVGIFLAFQSQAWQTDDQTGHAARERRRRRPSTFSSRKA